MTTPNFSNSGFAQPLTSAQTKSVGFNLVRWLPGLSLGLIVLLGAFLRFYQLGSFSIGNAYYAATVQSMLTSWHNFFYAAYEPGGSVAVDKPPLGFWVQVVSAYALGVNGFALALPQALAGTLSIPLLYLLAKRYFGVGSGLLAALVLATSPVTIATERNNTIDGLLLFVLLLAVWAIIKAVDSGRFRYLLLSMFLVGLGFNIKMMQAFLPLPAMAAFYFFGMPVSWLKRTMHLAVATGLLLVVSLAWAVVVDFTPPESRPFVGSSTNNTVLELIVGHNGLNRLFGRGGPGQPDDRPNGPPGQVGQFRPNPPLSGQDGNAANNDAIPTQPSMSQNIPPGVGRLAGTNLPPPEQQGRNPGPNDNPPGLANRPPGSPQGGPGGEIGDPGPLRLFVAPLSSEAGWLLPLALLGIPLTLGVAGWRWPFGDRQLALVLFGGWLVTQVVFFSVARFYHAYYLIMMGPPIAVMVGAAAWSLWQIYQQRPRLGWALLVLVVSGSLAYQLYVLQAAWVMTGTVAGLLAVCGVVLFTMDRGSDWLPKVGLALALLSLLAAPLVWAGLTTFNTNPDVALPRSGPTAGRPHRNSEVALSPAQATILDYVRANTTTGADGYLLAAGSSHEASPFILATGQPMLTFGGFNGGDDVISAGQLAQMVTAGKLRFVLGRQQQKPEIAAWLAQNCTEVSLPGLTTSTPDSDPARPALGSRQPGDTTLLDCGIN